MKIQGKVFRGVDEHLDKVLQVKVNVLGDLGNDLVPRHEDMNLKPHHPHKKKDTAL